MGKSKLTIVCTVVAIGFVFFAIVNGQLISFSNVSLSKPVSAIVVSCICSDIASETGKDAQDIEKSFESEDLVVIEDIINRNNSFSNIAETAGNMAEGEKFIDVVKDKVSDSDYEALEKIYSKYSNN